MTSQAPRKPRLSLLVTLHGLIQMFVVKPILIIALFSLLLTCYTLLMFYVAKFHTLALREVSDILGFCVTWDVIIAVKFGYCQRGNAQAISHRFGTLEGYISM